MESGDGGRRGLRHCEGSPPARLRCRQERKLQSLHAACPQPRERKPPTPNVSTLAIFNQKKFQKTTLKPALERLVQAHTLLLKNSREEDLLDKKASWGLSREEQERGWPGWLAARRGELLPAAVGRAGASPPCSGRRR